MSEGKKLLSALNRSDPGELMLTIALRGKGIIESNDITFKAGDFFREMGNKWSASVNLVSSFQREGYGRKKSHCLKGPQTPYCPRRGWFKKMRGLLREETEAGGFDRL